MGDIYSGAVLTIAAVGGTSAHSGLCGVSVRVRTQQTAGSFDGLEAFDILPGYDSCMKKSPWNDRGWTYQESCLSKRLLLFTEHQVFFRCESHLCFEDPSVGSYGLREWPRWEAPVDIAYGTEGSLRYDTIVHFSEALIAYCSRKLTLQSDIFNAFSGITQRLYMSSDNRVTFGLPEADINKALLYLVSSHLLVYLFIHIDHQSKCPH